MQRDHQTEAKKNCQILEACGWGNPRFSNGHFFADNPEFGRCQAPNFFEDERSCNIIMEKVISEGLKARYVEILCFGNEPGSFEHLTSPAWMRAEAFGQTMLLW